MNRVFPRLLCLLVLMGIPLSAFAVIDGASDCTAIYGTTAGIARVEELETLLHSMTVRADHPRLFVTAETLGDIQANWIYDNTSRVAILASATTGGISNVVSVALASLMYYGVDNALSLQYAEQARDIILNDNTAVAWTAWVYDKLVGHMALAYDWIYNNLSSYDRVTIESKLDNLSLITERYAMWDNTTGNFPSKLADNYPVKGEPFHREEWCFYAYVAWPEIALAHHNAVADNLYKARWRYDRYWGDAARMIAYAGDGAPFEGYYYGGDGISWFHALNSATGINIITDSRWPWFKGNLDYLLYRTDFVRGTEFFHRGVALGSGGLTNFGDNTAEISWKIKEEYR